MTTTEKKLSRAAALLGAARWKGVPAEERSELGRALAARRWPSFAAELEQAATEGDPELETAAEEGGDK